MLCLFVIGDVATTYILGASIGVGDATTSVGDVITGVGVVME